MERSSDSSSGMRDHHGNPANNRKRSVESPMEALPAKRPDRTKGQVERVYRELTSDAELSTDSFCLLYNIIKSSYPCAKTLLDPLWFNMKSESSGLPREFSDADRIVFPVHHKGYWALCLAYVTHSTPTEIAVYHYDSLPNAEPSYTAMCTHFRKRVEESEVEYHVTFTLIDDREGQPTSIHALSLLRYFVRSTGADAFELINPAAERKHLINLIKSDQDFELGEEELELRWGVKKMVEEAKCRLWQKIEESTLESLERDTKDAKKKLERAHGDYLYNDELEDIHHNQKEAAIKIQDDLAEAVGDIAGGDASHDTASIDTTQVTDSDPTNKAALVRSVNQIVGNYTQTISSILMNRVNKMVEKHQDDVKKASADVTRSRVEKLAAQWEVKRLEQMVRVKKALEYGGGGLIINH